MTIVILHLSDIHIKSEIDPVLKVGNFIAATTFESLTNASHVFILCSGDIAYSGSSKEYEAAKKLFYDIKRSIEKETTVPINFIFSPGNHDCDFSKNNAARDILVKSIEQSDSSTSIDDSVIKICTSIQENFRFFRDDFERDEFIVKDDGLFRRSEFKVNGKIIHFDCLNVSWVSKIQEKVGHLHFPFERYSEDDYGKADLKFMMFHHPLNWFNQRIYRPFRTFVRSSSDIIITGHEHEGTVGSINDAESGSSVYIEGCMLQRDSNDLTDSSFNVIVINLEESKFLSNKYEWSSNQYIPVEQNSWSSYHNLLGKKKSSFEITSSFFKELEDPGAFFKHPNKVNVSLSDIFVYPDIIKNTKTEDRGRVLESSSILLNPKTTATGVLITGEEKTGCTSLLYQIYRKYHEDGFIPLYIKGNDLKNINNDDICKLIKNAVIKQYGDNQVNPFSQLPSNKKILLLDNFDDTRIKSNSSRAKLLCDLRLRFDHLVVAASDIFELKEILDTDESNDLIELNHYTVQPFGYALRGELISKWFSLGSNETVSEGETIARIDQAEKQMDAVMQKSIIPAVPLYLLTLLQILDAGRSGDFKESSLGHYYDYLLSEAFQNAGVKPDKLTELFSYSKNLAWEFHQQGKREMNEADLRLFNRNFSNNWHTVDFESRIKVLLEARVLHNSGNGYTFRYPYVYYYLKGFYLSDHLQESSIKEYVNKCCQHLYVQDYANTVLFLAHHTNDSFVIDSISNALHSLFLDKAAMKFENDTGVINTIIEAAPKIAYSGEKPAEHRANINKMKDEINDEDDNQLEEEEELSLIAQITILFKTTEILGQVLKNQYSKIRREKKEALIENLFNGPLRSIRNFYDYFEKNPDLLSSEIEATLLRKKIVDGSEKANAISKQIVGQILQVITFGFLMRASQSANSESIFDDVHAVVNKINTPAFRLIELGILLDSPQQIPREFLKNLFNDVKNDLVASRIIQLMVIKRLYMFKTTEQDMQWIAQEIKINLKSQHAITYKDRKHRMFK